MKIRVLISTVIMVPVCLIVFSGTTLFCVEQSVGYSTEDLKNFESAVDNFLYSSQKESIDSLKKGDVQVSNGSGSHMKKSEQTGEAEKTVKRGITTGNVDQNSENELYRNNEIAKEDGFSKKNSDMSKSIVNSRKKNAHVKIDGPDLSTYKSRSFPINSKVKRYAKEVPGNKPWKRTIHVDKGDIISISASGRINTGYVEMRLKNHFSRPDGLGFKRGSFTILKDTSYLALIGRIGDGQPFYIGSKKEFKSPSKGRLYLGINELIKSPYTMKTLKERSVYCRDNTGEYIADILILKRRHINES